MVMHLNGIKRRQLINDLFEFINDNKYEFNVNIFNELEIKLMGLYIANEQSYKLCKFWKRCGHCPNRARCPFQHFMLVKHDQKCHFHQNNSCNRGKDCFYTHNYNDNPFNFNHRFNVRSEIPPIPPSIVIMNQAWDNSHASHNHSHNHDHHHNIHCDNPNYGRKRRNSINNNNVNNNGDDQHSILLTPSVIIPTEIDQVISDINSKETMENIEVNEDTSKKNKETSLSSPNNNQSMLPTSETIETSLSNENNSIKETSTLSSNIDNTDDDCNECVIDNNGIEAMEKKGNICEENNLDISQENSNQSSLPTTNIDINTFDTNHGYIINENICKDLESSLTNIVNGTVNCAEIEAFPDDLEVSSVSTVNTTNTLDTGNTEDDMEKLYHSFYNEYDSAAILINKKPFGEINSYAEAWNILAKIFSNNEYLFKLRNHPKLAEAHLMMAYLCENAGQYKNALRHVDDINDPSSLPRDLQRRINIARNGLYGLL